MQPLEHAGEVVGAARSKPFQHGNVPPFAGLMEGGRGPFRFVDVFDRGTA
jgi:hypothetical protein